MDEKYEETMENLENVNQSGGEATPEVTAPEQAAEPAVPETEGLAVPLEAEAAPAGQPEPARTPPPVQNVKRPFFSDTWQIFRRMFGARCGNILSVASTDSHPTWAANLIVCLAAELLALILAGIRMTAYFFGGFGRVAAGIVIGGLFSFAAAAFLLILAVKVLLHVLNRSIPFGRVANVVSACLLVNAAFVLAGGILSLFFPSLILLGLSLGSMASTVLVYVGVKQFLEPGREPVWPYIWTTVVYYVVTAVAAALFLIASMGGALLSLVQWYF